MQYYWHAQPLSLLLPLPLIRGTRVPLSANLIVGSINVGPFLSFFISCASARVDLLEFLAD